jgi:hypothetical protein
MNNTMVREIHGAKINPNHTFKIRVRKIRGGANYASKYDTSCKPVCEECTKCIIYQHYLRVLRILQRLSSLMIPSAMNAVRCYRSHVSISSSTSPSLANLLPHESSYWTKYVICDIRWKQVGLLRCVGEVQLTAA